MIGRLVPLVVRLLLAAAGIAVAVGMRRARSGAAPPAGERADASRTGQDRRRVLPWLLAGGALLIGAGMLGFLVAASGIVPIKASSGHWPITAWFLDFAKQRSVSTHTLGTSVPPLDDRSMVLKGAGHYHSACRPCHGSPGFDQPRVARQMTPRPPALQSAAFEFEPEELFYIVRHGIKFTGMPAWPALGRDDEVWAMVAFLQRLPELDAGEYEKLATGTNPAPDAGDPTEDLVVPAKVPQAIRESCARCHGMSGLGRGVGAFPTLAGQRAEYLFNTLVAYGRGERHSGMMEPVAAALDPEQMRAIARYYAASPARPRPSDGAAAELVAEGARIAAQGLPDQLVPPCSRCHGPDPVERNPAYPVLAGQYAEYLLLQLRLFHDSRRGGTEYHDIMRRVAGQLEEEQMRAVAAYYASLDPE